MLKSELIKELEYFRVSLPLEYREEATELFDKIIGVLKKDGGRPCKSSLRILTNTIKFNNRKNYAKCS